MSLRCLSVRSSVVLSTLAFFATLAIGQAVTTYHVDNNRTGWNSHETVLTPANVASSSFGLLHMVALTIRSTDSLSSFPV